MISSARFARLDSRVKIVLVFGLVVGLVSMPLPNIASGAPLAIAVFALALLARLSIGDVGRALLAVLPFAGLAALSLPFAVPGDALWSLQLGPVNLQISEEGLIWATAIVVRSMLAAVALAALTASTPFERLAEGLAGLGLPPATVMTLCSLHRYIPVVGQEAFRLVRAARARGGKHGGGIGGAGALIAALLLRSLDRADRVHRAMIARGFDGSGVKTKTARLRRHDLAWLTGGTLTIATTLLTSIWIGY